MLLEHFRFREDPFGATPDPRCLYPSNTHREALASLAYAFFSNRGFTSLIAPPGMGKTTLLFRFLDDIRESARTVFLFDLDSECGARELISHILRDMGITPGASSGDMHEQLNRVVVAEALAGRKVVIVIDEAQNLSEAALETVRLLTNFETPQAKLMQIVLAGQPQLDEKLARPSLEQLRQRISTFCRLEPLSKDQVSAYIDHRLKSAGYRGEALFSTDALSLIARASSGIPRKINNICFNALSICCALKSKKVEESMVAEAIQDLQFTPAPAKVIPMSRPPAPVEQPHEAAKLKWQGIQVPFLTPTAAAILLGSGLGLLTVGGFLTTRSHQTVHADSTVLKSAIAAPLTPTPDNSPFQVFAGPHQSLRDISNEYLGVSDERHLYQIRNLNPALVDPDQVESGRAIWLPGPRVTVVAKNPTLIDKAGEKP